MGGWVGGGVSSLCFSLTVDEGDGLKLLSLVELQGHKGTPGGLHEVLHLGGWVGG